MAFCYAYEPYGTVEDLEAYEPGGFLPLMRGDTVGPNQRFQICEKLGNGGFGTVWMCRDRVQKKWKAVKVLSATASGSANDNDCNELAILEHFQKLKVSREDLDASHICLPEEHFWQEGPHGDHLCLILPILGESIEGVWDRYGDRPDILRDICLQLVQAMMFLHDKGICHGDFRSANILLKYPGIEDLSHEDMMAALSESEEVQLALVDEVAEGEPQPELPANYPPSVFTATSLNMPPDYSKVEIVVTDFGEAYHATNPPSANGIPLSHAAPEVIFGGEDDYRLGYAADIWALGTTICEVRQGCTPWDHQNTDRWVKRLEEILGPLPEPYRTTYIDSGYTNKWVSTPPKEIPPTENLTWSADGLQQFRKHGYSSWLERQVRMQCTMTLRINEGDDLTNKKNQEVLEHDPRYKRVVYETPAEEADQLLDLFKKTFRYHPKDRISIDEVMEHPWMTLNFDEEATSEEEPHVTTEAPVVEEMDPLETVKTNTSQTSSGDNVSYVSADENHSPETTAASENVAKPTSETISPSLTATAPIMAEQDTHRSVRVKLWECFGFMTLYQGCKRLCKRLWKQACRRARGQ